MMKSKKLLRKLVSALLLALVLFFALAIAWQVKFRVSHNEPKALCKNCNVVVIDIDTLRFDELPCYGYKRNTTPNLCKLAEEGVIFRNNFSQSYWTLPSITSTMTSLYTSTHKVYHSYTDLIAPEISTMADYFTHAGYMTISTLADEVDFLPINANKGFTKKIQLSEILGDNNLLKELTQTKQPLLLYLYFLDLHSPYLLPEGAEPIENLERPDRFLSTEKEFYKAFGEYLAKNPRKAFTEKGIKAHPELFENGSKGKEQALGDYFRAAKPDSGEIEERFAIVRDFYHARAEKDGKIDAEYLRVMYDTKLFLLDKELGELLDTFLVQKQKKKTIILLISEHGEYIGEHGIFGHQPPLFNEVLHTPLIISAPNVKSGDIQAVTQNIDILPTLMELVGIPISKQTQGKSLVTLMKKGDSGISRYAVSESGADASIQDSHWKLIAYDYEPPWARLELYDLNSDPHEEENVFGQNRELAENLLGQLRKILADSKGRYLISPQPFPTWIDEETRKRLIEQGYF